MGKYTLLAGSLCGLVSISCSDGASVTGSSASTSAALEAGEWVASPKMFFTPPDLDTIRYCKDAEVGWDGTSYVVVYDDSGSVRASRFSSEGETLDVPSLNLGQNLTPELACNDGECFLAWTKTLNATHVYGRFFRPGSQWGKTPAIEISGPVAASQSGPLRLTDVATDGTGYFVVWSHLDEMYASYVTSSDAGTPVSLGKVPDLYTVISVTSGGPGFLVTWRKLNDPVIWGRLFAKDGTPQGNAAELVSSAVNWPRFVSDGESFALLAYESETGNTAEPLFFQPFSASLEPGTRVVLGKGLDAAAGRTSDGYQVAYRDDDGVRALLLKDGFTEVPAATPLELRMMPGGDPGRLAVVVKPDTNLVVSCDGSLMARNLSSDGKPSGEPFWPALKPGRRSGPEFASANEHGHLLGWEETSSDGSGYVVRVARVTPEGSLIDTTPIRLEGTRSSYDGAWNGQTIIATVTPHQAVILADAPWSYSTPHATHVATNGDSFFAAWWGQYRSGTYNWEAVVRGARFSSTGELLDDPPIEFCSDYGTGEEATECQVPFVESNGDGFIVGWGSASNGTHVAPVTSEGQVLDTIILPFAPEGATSNGDDYVFWSGPDEAQFVRMESDGTLGSSWTEAMPLPTIGGGRERRVVGSGGNYYWFESSWRESATVMTTLGSDGQWGDFEEAPFLGGSLLTSAIPDVFVAFTGYALEPGQRAIADVYARVITRAAPLGGECLGSYQCTTGACTDGHCVIVDSGSPLKPDGGADAGSTTDAASSVDARVNDADVLDDAAVGAPDAGGPVSSKDAAVEDSSPGVPGTPDASPGTPHDAAHADADASTGHGRPDDGCACDVVLPSRSRDWQWLSLSLAAALVAVRRSARARA